MIVGLCDDDLFWLKKAKVIIENYFRYINDKVEIYCFISFKEMVESETIPFDVIFMDIEFDEKKENAANNGINYVKYINKTWKSCQIVYLTNYLYYAMDVYETKHIYFVVKEDFETKIHNVFEKVRHNIEQNSLKYVFTEIGGNIISINADEIKYFERSKRDTKIKTSWGEYYTREKIGDIYNRLSQIDFVRCHNSYIVYLPAIQELLKDEIITEDGTRIMISRSYRKSVKQAFARWALTQLI